MSYLPRVLVSLMSLLPVVSQAGTEHGTEAPAPSLEFLEFLSEWETEQGTWEGPAQFEDDSFDQVYEPGDIEDERDD